METNFPLLEGGLDLVTGFFFFNYLLFGAALRAALLREGFL